jgi:hypothetical protein
MILLFPLLITEKSGSESCAFARKELRSRRKRISFFMDIETEKGLFFDKHGFQR